MIKPQLQFKLSQQLVMTPQLQQSIRLLQLSTLELQETLQQAVEENPLLDFDEPFDEIDVTEETAADASHQDTISLNDAIDNQMILTDLPLDTSFDDVYFPDFSASYDSSRGTSSLPDMTKTTLSLHDHLLWQAQLTPFSEKEMAIAQAFIDAIDANGYLTASLAEIQESVGDNTSLDELNIVLKRLQHFDPVGVGAQNLQECLRIQLMQYAPDTPFLAEALMLIEHHLDILGNHDIRAISKVTQCDKDTLKSALMLIKTLNPHPGKQIDAEPPEYIIPDIMVKKHQGKWHVFFNDNSIPRVSINQHYANLSSTLTNVDEQQFIRSHLQNANWLLKSLENRNETILKVSRCLVEFQQAFFEHGEEYLKPMILSDVAHTIDMHESTISRATTAKYLQCPRGVFELKYFFSSHLQTHQGADASSTAIKALIKKCIAAENSAKPLSDSKIAEFLENKGIIVARRTIAKYRELLGILPSNQRKKLL